jgi:hypothetical protein
VATIDPLNGCAYRKTNIATKAFSSYWRHIDILLSEGHC